MKHFKIIISYQYAHFGCIKKVLLRCLFYVPPKTQVLKKITGNNHFGGVFRHFMANSKF